jgi:SAM-dependent methyltransferase
MPRVDVAQGDLFAPPFRERQFDFVICDGVLHHTHDTRAAFRSLVPLLEPGGMMCIHVYKRMNPVREFADGYIRDRFSSMTPEECWEACKPITGLGKALLETDAEVTVPEDIPVLGIKAGSYNLQRFFYYEILKCFWNDLFTFEENNQAVFDHYHPVYAHKQTEEEVVGWFEEVGLEEITVYRGSPNGISVTATAPTA